jgi:hypothetical protein
MSCTISNNKGFVIFAVLYQTNIGIHSTITGLKVESKVSRGMVVGFICNMGG